MSQALAKIKIFLSYKHLDNSYLAFNTNLI